jgi:two-component system CheB/CheR fusion protein
LRGLYRITFDHVSAERKRSGKTVGPPDRVRELERELQYTKESLQSTIEELETANEELKSTNEEMQSTNEELQSTNEELETSKEEMQSLNEELQTVNAELQGKVEELSRTNDDMKNLLNGTDIATIFLDNELHIKRYTEQARKVIRLIPSDIGRPIGDLVSSLHYDRLVEDARLVLRTLVSREIDVQADNGAWYLMRMVPYRTTENVIDGLVLTFVDITKLRALQEEQSSLLAALFNSPTTVCGHDRELRYTWASAPVLGRPVSELIGKTDAEVFGAENVKAMAALKRRCVETETPIREKIDVVLGAGRRTLDLYAEPVRDRGDSLTGISCVVTDVT